MFYAVIFLFLYCLIPPSRSQIFSTPLRKKSCRNIMTISVLHLEMQMRKCRVARVSAISDQLSFLNCISNIHDHAVFLQMPIHCNTSIRMTNNNMVAFAEVFRFCSTHITVFSQGFYNAFTSREDLTSLSHFKVKA